VLPEAAELTVIQPKRCCRSAYNPPKCHKRSGATEQPETSDLNGTVPDPEQMFGRDCGA
jgi:hypothetical protein